MTKLLSRIAAIAGGCIGLAACAQPQSQPQTETAQPVVMERARVCTTRGQPAVTGDANPWAITVSSDGKWCPHTRRLGRGTTRPYDILVAPQHGEIMQQPADGKMTVSFKAQKGYTGSDTFRLRYGGLGGGRPTEMPYLVNIIP